jgi:hypothetical protein
MQLWKGIKMPQTNQNCPNLITWPWFFLTFQEYLKILAQVAIEIWKSLQLDLILEKKTPKTEATLEQGAKTLRTHQNSPI